MQNIFVHETSIVDQNVKIGEGTKIWHFSILPFGNMKMPYFGLHIEGSNQVKHFFHFIYYHIIAGRGGTLLIFP